MNPGGSNSCKLFFRALAVGAGMGLLMVLLVGIRLSVLSANHFKQAEIAEQNQKFQESIEAYTWAIRNHFPGNPYSARSVENALRLIDERHDETSSAQRKNALLQLRAALLSIRSCYQPFNTQLQQIDRQIEAYPNP